MKKNNNHLILQKMEKHCKEILEYLDKYDYSFKEFENNHEFRNALSMAMFATQELSNHLTSEFLESTESEIKWHSLQGMRNLFGHEYDEMDSEIIFNTAINDIPVLLKFLEKEISQYKNIIYENKNAKVNVAGDITLEEKPIIEVPSKEDFKKNIYNMFSLIEEEYNDIDNWELPKSTLIEEVENIFVNSIDFFLDNYGDKIDSYLQYIPEEYKNIDFKKEKILINFLSDEIINKFGTAEELVEVNKKELENRKEDHQEE